MFAAARSIRCLRGFATEAKAPDAVKQWSLRDFLGRNGQGVFNIGVSFAVTVLASQVLSAKQLRESLEVEVDAARGEIQTLRSRVRERRVPVFFKRWRRAERRLVASPGRLAPLTPYPAGLGSRGAPVHRGPPQVRRGRARARDQARARPAARRARAAGRAAVDHLR